MTIHRSVDFEQPDFMWQYMLRYERCVVAQYEVDAVFMCRFWVCFCFALPPLLFVCFQILICIILFCVLAATLMNRFTYLRLWHISRLMLTSVAMVCCIFSSHFWNNGIGIGNLKDLQPVKLSYCICEQAQSPTYLGNTIQKFIIDMPNHSYRLAARSMELTWDLKFYMWIETRPLEHCQ